MSSNKCLRRSIDVHLSAQSIADRKPKTPEQDLYWCSIDLQKFYPSLSLDVVQENIVELLPLSWRGDANSLLKSMLRFRLIFE